MAMKKSRLTDAQIAFVLRQAKVGPAVEEVSAMPTGDHAMLPVFADKIRKRCRRVRANLAVDA
jgi:hypothetical protein